MTPTTVHVRIAGRVQGVWFRGWTVQQAQQLGLDGWVRNRRDGSVEAVFSGPEEQVEEMLAHCRWGPPAANVTSVDSGPAETPPEPGFRHLPTV